MGCCLVLEAEPMLRFLRRPPKLKAPGRADAACASDSAGESKAAGSRLALLDVAQSPHHSFIQSGRGDVQAEIDARFPGWGEVFVYQDGSSSIERAESHHAKLGQLTATAICGNDITGSCFYVMGGLAAAAGVWAPVGAVVASATLWLFRWVYTEAVTALPFNGGIYNVLLNTVRSKRIAGLVATLTMLSYIATCVVSALSAGAYLQTVIDPTKRDPTESGCFIVPIAIALIVAFAVLKILGISESAKVAACMFVAHLTIMLTLMTVTFLSIALPTSGLPFGKVASNLQANFRYTGGAASIAEKIVLGFSSSMLGVSGFESSANFVEEQQEGVFPKTLRNMWYGVTLLNVGFILECVFATELEELVKEKDNALAYLARMAVGRWLEVVVSLDAFMILAAAILTSYVGIGGLVSRMAGDRCLPRVFRKEERITTVLFAMICISLVLILQGNSTKLGACYAFAFLTVMLMFAISLFVLQTTRPKLPRSMKNNLLIPAAAALLVAIALSGTIVTSADVIPIFLMYLSVLVVLVGGFLFRLPILHALQQISCWRCCPSRCWTGGLERIVNSIQRQSSVVYFTKTTNICRLNQVIQYIQRNEDTNHCRIVHLYDEEVGIPRKFVPLCQVLDVIYPSTKIDLVFVQGRFGAPMIMHLSEAWGVPPSMMFISCPTSEELGRRVSDFRGVRIIMGHEEEKSIPSIGPSDPILPGVDGEMDKPTELLRLGLARQVSAESFLASGANARLRRIRSAPAADENHGVATELQRNRSDPAQQGTF